MEWQGEDYDADGSDEEGLAEMPRPVASNHPNYPLEELEKDVEFNFEFLRELRAEGTLLPEDVEKIKRVMQLFRRDLNIVLQAANSRYLPVVATCGLEEPELEELPQSAIETANVEGLLSSGEVVEKPESESSPDLGAESAEKEGQVTPGKVDKNQEKEQSRVSPDSGLGTSPRTLPRRVKFAEPEIKDTGRSSDSANGSSLRNRPKPAKSSQVKHKARHKPKNHTKEIKRLEQTVITMLNGNGNDMETEWNPEIGEIVGLISDMRKKDPDLPINEWLSEYFGKFY